MTATSEEPTGRPPTRVSYAQNSEDVRAWRALRDVERPFYVEVGASDPLVDSVTATLSAEGACGLLVEADPEFAALLRVARPRDTVVAAAASSSAGVLTWHDLGTRGRGTVATAGGGPGAGGAAGAAGSVRTVSVPAVRLDDLLDDLAPTDVHFLSVDVEGHEAEVLQGLDLSRWRPWIVSVEATAPGTRIPTHTTWEPRLLESDYQFVCFDGLNRWYVAAEHAELSAPVREPFNALDEILDGWRRREVVALEAEVERLRSDYDAAVAQVQAGEELLRRSEQQRRREQSLTTDLQRQLADAVEAAAEQAQSLSRAQREIDLVAAQRDAAVARERVMLTSKSWRLTGPLRGLRREATSAAARRGLTEAGAGTAALSAAVPAHAVAHVDTPADLRRRRALAAKLRSATRRGPQ